MKKQQSACRRGARRSSAVHRPRGASLIRKGKPMACALRTTAAMRLLIVEGSEDLASALRDAGCNDYVVMRAEELQALQAELAEAKAKLAERKVVERAKGILMRVHGIDEETAYTTLRKHAMDRNLKLAEVAQRVLDSVHDDDAAHTKSARRA
jgi:hypothetical protein